MKLADFLIKLASDSKRLERYEGDREGAIQRARLSQSAKQALLSGDSRNIQKVLSEESVEIPFILLPGQKSALKVVAARGGNLLVKKLVVRRGQR